MEGRKVWHLAPPKGFERDDTAGAGTIFGDDRGLGEAEALSERGRSSSFLRPIGGVGGVEPLAKCVFEIDTILRGRKVHSREGLVRLRQSPSSARKENVSAFARNLAPGLSSVGVGDGLNLEPIDHTSSLSATLSPFENPDPFRSGIFASGSFVAR